MYKPWEITPEEVEMEARTGQVRSLRRDRHDRPILIFDNTRENSKNLEKQLRHLAGRCRLKRAA